MDEFHEVVEVAAGARDDPGRIDELRMEMILEEGQHDEPQEARDADDEDGQEQRDAGEHLAEHPASHGVRQPAVERALVQHHRHLG